MHAGAEAAALAFAEGVLYARPRRAGRACGQGPRGTDLCRLMGPFEVRGPAFGVGERPLPSDLRPIGTAKNLGQHRPYTAPDCGAACFWTVL